MLNKIDKSGFTLAEVLLTLSIIGIVTAMTIPSLINSTNKMENVVALKKTYSTLMQATLMITADNGGDIVSALSGVATSEDLANVFIPKLNVAKNCGTASAKATGCFPDLTYKMIDGITDWANLSSAVGRSSILTNDGMSYWFALYSASCATHKSDPSEDTASPLYNTCGLIYIDVNGPNKGPAIVGRDLFCFILTLKGLYPFGAYPYIGVPSDCIGTNGSACTNKVLMESAMSY
ncbi:MAG: type II secretion system protein [Candidatus Gastranaerophilaceae bacterium]|jgi:prepilin-type N-terminal cleavage/methylation domain-containing protein